MQEHHSTAPLQLIMPVLTEPTVVHAAVTALHCGTIRLSLCNVENILVLANAIGVSVTRWCSAIYSEVDACNLIKPLVYRWNVWSQLASSIYATKRTT